MYNYNGQKVDQVRIVLLATNMNAVGEYSSLTSFCPFSLPESLVTATSIPNFKCGLNCVNLFKFLKRNHAII